MGILLSNCCFLIYIHTTTTCLSVFSVLKIGNLMTDRRMAMSSKCIALLYSESRRLLFLFLHHCTGPAVDRRHDDDLGDAKRPNK